MSLRAATLVRRCYAAMPRGVRRAASRSYQRIPFPWDRGPVFARHYRRFEHTEWCSAHELEALQQAQLRRILRHAYDTVPSYHERFERLGLSWRDIRCVEDLAALPLTHKNELQDSREQFVSRGVPRSQILFRTTSGSTGTPLKIALTSSTQLAERAMMWRGWRWSGYRPGDRVASCVGELTGTVLGDKHAPYSAYRDFLELSPHHLTQRACDTYLDLMFRFRPHFIRSYPSILELLGRRMHERGIEIRSVRALWTQSEVLGRSDRALLQSLWAAPVFDYYGMQEKCIAMSECEHGRLHLNSEFGLLELLPSEIPPLCHVVATGFYNPAMPLLRYHTRDLAEPYADPCPCGRAHPTVKRIVGRVEDFLFAADGHMVVEVDSAIAAISTIRECQFVQESLGHVRVLVVPAPGFDESHEALLAERARSLLGHEMRLDIERHTSLPRTKSGKRRFIVSKLEPSRKL